MAQNCGSGRGKWGRICLYLAGKSRKIGFILFISLFFYYILCFVEGFTEATSNGYSRASRFQMLQNHSSSCVSCSGTIQVLRDIFFFWGGEGSEGGDPGATQRGAAGAQHWGGKQLDLTEGWAQGGCCLIATPPPATAAQMLRGGVIRG